MNEELQKQVNAALDEALKEKQRNKDFVKSIGPAIVEMLRPILETFSLNAKTSKEDILNAVSKIKIDVPKADVPHATVDVKIPTITVPKPQVTVNIPPIKIPDIHIPKIVVPKPEVTVNIPKAEAPIVNVAPTPVTFPSEMSLRHGDRPFPVVMMDVKGKPMQFPQQMSGGATGGRGDFFTIVGIQNSVAVMQVDSTGIAYSGSNPVPVQLVSGGSATTASAIVDSTGVQYSGSNPVPITIISGSSAGTQYNDSATPDQAGGVLTLIGAYDGTGSVFSARIGTGVSNQALRVVHAADVGISAFVGSASGGADGLTSNQIIPSGINGTNAPLVTVPFMFNGSSWDRPRNTGGEGNALRVQQSKDSVSSVYVQNPVDQGDSATALRVVIAGNTDASVTATQTGTWNITTLTSITNTVAASLVDSSGVQYSGSNPLPTTAVATLSAATGQGDGAAALRTIQAGDTVSSMNILQINGNTPAAGQNETTSGVLRVVHMTDTAISVSATQVGTWNITTLTGITNTVAASLVDSSGVQYSGSNPLPTTASLSLPSGPGDGATATRFIQAGDTVSSVNILQINGNAPATGLNETNSGVLRVVHMTDTAISVSASQVGTWNITTLTGITNSVAAALTDSSGVQYSGSNPLPVTFAGSASSSVSLVNSQGTYYNSDNPFFVATAATGLNETNSLVLRTVAMTDSNSSVNVVTFNGNAPATGLNETTSGVLRTVSMSDTVSSVYVNNPFGQGDVATALRVVQAGNVASSVMSAATGLNETTVDVLRVVTMSDTASSVQAKVLAMTTLPAAAADAATSFQKSDKLGRALARPIQVRDLISTAYVSLTTGTEANLLAAVAGQTFDLIWILMSNQSTAAVQIDVRPVTAGNIAMTFQVPGNGTVGIAPPVPLLGASDTGNNWTVDMPDITGTTVNISALFSREV